MKNKKNMSMVAIIGLLFFTANSLAAGTEVGQGSGSERDNNIANLKQEILGTEVIVENKITINNGDNGDSQSQADNLQQIGVDMIGNPMLSTSLDNIYAWCSRVIRVLRREGQRAKLQLQFNRLDLAMRIVMDSLVAASQTLAVDPTAGGPLTKNLVDRGLVVATALNQRLPSGSRHAQMSKLNFLFDYVDFIVAVESTLDRPYYIPYRYQYSACRWRDAGRPDYIYPPVCPEQFDYRAFEGQFIEYARKQLEFATRFTEIVTNYGESRVVPIGNGKAFLTISEFFAKFVADDIRNTLYAYQHACVVVELEILYDKLKRFNLFGDRTYYISEPFAVAMVRDDLFWAIGELRNEVSILGCAGSRY